MVLCNLPCRIVLIVINSATGLLGLVLLAVGALMVWGKAAVASILNQLITPLLDKIGSTQDAAQVTALFSKILTSTAPVGWALFCFGASLAILSFIGYCGACCNYKSLLYIYAIIIGVLALAILIVIIVYFAGRNKLADYCVRLFETSVKAYSNMSDNTADSLLVGLLQPKLMCCGVDGPADFTNKSSTDTYGGKSYTNVVLVIPCCKMDNAYRILDDTCPSRPTDENSYMGSPCREPLKAKFIYYMNYAAYGLIGTFVVLLILVLFTILTIRIDIV